MGRMPAVKFSTRMQLRNRTAVLWNRKFSTRLFVQQRRSSGEIVDRAKAAAANSGRKQVSMKWVVLTSFTIVLGTILLVSRNVVQRRMLQRAKREKDKKNQNI